MERSKNLPIAGLLAAAAILIVAGIVAVRVVLEHSARSQAVATFADATAQADEAAALKAAQPIDPAMIGYHEAGTFDVDLHELRALAVDGDGQIYVGGDKVVVHYAGDGKKLAEISLEGQPQCLAVGTPEHVHPRRLYVGLEGHVEVYDLHAKRIAVWESRGPEAVFTSITTTDNEVWVADAGNRIVWRFDAAGKLLGPVGKPDPSQRHPDSRSPATISIWPPEPMA